MILKLIIFTGCLNLNDPTNTTDIIPYPPPTVDFMRVYSNAFDIQIRSYLKNTGDMEGYLIYLSDNASDIANLSQNNLNNLTDISVKPGFFTNLTNREIRVNYQFVTAFGLIITNTNRLYMAVSVYGQNGDYARVHTNRGYVESLPTIVSSFYVRKLSDFSLNSFSNTSSNSSSLNYSNGNLYVTNTSSSLSTHLLHVLTTSNVNKAYPIFQVGNNTSIQSLGLGSDFNSLITLPESGYTSQPVPIISNHTYAVKHNDVYFKLHVTNISNENFNNLNDALTINGRSAFVPAENALRF